MAWAAAAAIDAAARPYRARSSNVPARSAMAESAPVNAAAYARWRRALAGRELPCAVVDLDAFDANAAAIVERAAGLPVRVASKSLRCRALVERIQSLDARFRGLMCFTAAEAVWLSARGFDDLLVAYPTPAERHIAAVCGRIAAGKRLVLTVDSTAHIEKIAPIAAEYNVIVPLSVELDLSLRLPGLNFGVWRSPLRGLGQLRALAARIARHPHLRLAGVMGYEAQLAGVTDAAAGQRLHNAAVRLLKALSRRAITRRRGALETEGLDLDFVNAGGTGSLEFSARTPGVTEVTAGSGFYCPTLFDGYAGFSHRPAAAFALAVARVPAPGMVTCLGGGYVASGAPGADRAPRPWLPRGAKLTATEGAGEVQTPLAYTGPVDLKLGDPVLFRHAKAGELCERFNTLLLVRGDTVVDAVATYRGEGQCFL